MHDATGRPSQGLKPSWDRLCGAPDQPFSPPRQGQPDRGRQDQGGRREEVSWWSSEVSCLCLPAFICWWWPVAVWESLILVLNLQTRLFCIFVVTHVLQICIYEWRTWKKCCLRIIDRLAKWRRIFDWLHLHFFLDFSNIFIRFNAFICHDSHSFQWYQSSQLRDCNLAIDAKAVRIQCLLLNAIVWRSFLLQVLNMAVFSSTPQRCMVPRSSLGSCVVATKWPNTCFRATQEKRKQKLLVTIRTTLDTKW